MRSVPNWIAVAVTAVALVTVLFWSARPMTGSWEYPAGGGRRPSVRHPLTFQGFSYGESWGRWTNDEVATLTFGRPLPRRFVAVLRGHAFGPNIGEPVRICAHRECAAATFGAEDADVSLSFRTPGGARRLTIHVPKPTAAGERDSRLLGIGLVSVRIEEVR